jgi:hypothetical protein
VVKGKWEITGQGLRDRAVEEFGWVGVYEVRAAEGEYGVKIQEVDAVD